MGACSIRYDTNYYLKSDLNQLVSRRASIMKKTYTTKRPALIFPEANAYSVDEILNFIAAVVHPVDPDLHHVDSNTEYRKEYKAYLIERLLEAVVGRQFELWDTYLGKVVAPPVGRPSSQSKVLVASQKPSATKSFWRLLNQKFSRPPELAFIQALAKPAIAKNNIHPRPVYKDNLWWAKMTCILKPDLVKFCNAERFIVTFEGVEKLTDKQAGTQAITTEPEQEDSASQNEAKAQPTNNRTTQSLPAEDKPSQQQLGNAQPSQDQLAMDNHNAWQLHVDQAEQKLTINDQGAVTDSSDPPTNTKSPQKPEDKSEIDEKESKPISSIIVNEERNCKQQKKGQTKIQEQIRNFDSLPDSFPVDVRVVAAVVGCSVPTIWRRVKKGQLVAPVPNEPGTRTTRWLVGGLRKFLGLSKPQSK